LGGVDDKVLAGDANVLPDNGLGRRMLSGRKVRHDEVARAMDRVCAYGFGENTRDKLICATRAGRGNVELVLPIKFAPGVASTEKELELLVGRRGFRLGKVHETVVG
jgi:hypothetical protein